MVVGLVEGWMDDRKGRWVVKMEAEGLMHEKMLDCAVVRSLPFVQVIQGPCDSAFTSLVIVHCNDEFSSVAVIFAHPRHRS